MSAVIVNRYDCTDTSACFSFIGLQKNIFSKPSLKIYPNPATDKLTIELSGDINIHQIDIYNISGQKVQSSAQIGELNISELKQGIYLINLKTSEGNMTSKFVKG
ncbi:hypothetical protein FHS59_000083 [Algoriphagus iocasae]|uniref:Secretion system C-terminal sorting domain-containing protein n=1 Tax=Algoriphagus iocasae TaxID=1836499 RepID=A0A841MPB0_9BACT|nr:T9SS type A sorting domain-containing protein [Algoriphagus iocasae]MBB6324468.1 hypothetical protein [Algoriphagus iocasae]